MSGPGKDIASGSGNSRTRITRSARSGLSESPTLKQCWSAHYDALFQRFQAGKGWGFAVALFDASVGLCAAARLNVRVGQEASIVWGRHSECTLRSPGDSAVALRQALLIARSPAPDAPCVLDVLDLRTESGFAVLGHGSSRAIEVVGALSLSVCSMRMIALPLCASGWPSSSRKAWKHFFGEPSSMTTTGAVSLPDVRRTHVHPGSIQALVAEMDGLLSPREGRTVHQIANVPGLLRRRPTRGGANSDWEADVEGAGPLNEESLSLEYNPSAATLAMEGPGGQAEATLQQQDLRRGVLIGRYDRCLGEGRGELFDDAVSRVHAMLRRDAQGDIRIYDCASSNGVCIESQAAGALPGLARMDGYDSAVRVHAANIQPGDRIWLSEESSLKLSNISLDGADRWH